jgi:hypothetical protein
MSEEFKDVLLASNFSNNKLTEYRYKWNNKFYIYKKDHQIIYTLPNKATRRSLCFLILNSFELIDVNISQDDSRKFFEDAGVKSSNTNTPREYITFKDLLVTIAKSRNTLKYKFCITSDGVLIWKDNPKHPIFYESYWSTFARQVLLYFKISPKEMI